MLPPRNIRTEARCSKRGSAQERIRERIADVPLMLDDGKSVRTSVSIGVAGSREPREGLESLLKRADDAMYAAKREGRNRVVVG